MYVSSLPENTHFDFVIVGAGSAGCVLANRLSESRDNRVLLIEAGGRDSSINIRIPLLVAKLVADEHLTWPYTTEPQKQLAGKRHSWVRGKVLGGSGSINGNMFVRGDPMEYDAWRDAGCTEWGYADLLPYFKMLETFPSGDRAVRGDRGPIGITQVNKFDELAGAFVDACGQMGLQHVRDYNDGENYEGASYPQLSTRRGLRSSSSFEYLHPAVKRPNLTVLLDTTVRHILFEGARALGVDFFHGNIQNKVFGDREVIISGGPLQSPKLLQHSGVGDAQLLQKHGINVVKHLPGVGENLRDHLSVRLTYECNLPITINDVLDSPWRKLCEGLKFAFKREGILTISSTTARAVMRSKDEVKQPDLIFRMLARSGNDRYTKDIAAGSDRYSGFSLGLNPIRPYSSGFVHIASPNPLDQPKIDPNYLSDERDIDLTLRGVHIARRIAAAAPLKQLIVRETRPGPDVQDEGELLQYLQATAATCWHMVGTCKMGTDPMAVVDPQLRVRGLNNLRIIDSSICPTLPSTNTNAPTLAIAEKGAAMISETYSH